MAFFWLWCLVRLFGPYLPAEATLLVDNNGHYVFERTGSRTVEYTTIAVVASNFTAYFSFRWRAESA